MASLSKGLVARIIPALAGNTTSIRMACCWRPDHPRSRGEYHESAPALSPYPGSSPLSRGILHQLAGLRFINRIIPALAGNTQ